MNYYAPNQHMALSCKLLPKVIPPESCLLYLFAKKHIARIAKYLAVMEEGFKMPLKVLTTSATVLMRTVC